MSIDRIKNHIERKKSERGIDGSVKNKQINKNKKYYWKINEKMEQKFQEKTDISKWWKRFANL